MMYLTHGKTIQTTNLLAPAACSHRDFFPISFDTKVTLGIVPTLVVVFGPCDFFGDNDACCLCSTICKMMYAARPLATVVSVVMQEDGGAELLSIHTV